MYLGMTVMLLLMNAVFIPFEESRLCEIFGQQYSEYARHVKRWL